MNVRSAAQGIQKRFRPVSYSLVFLMMACVVLTLSILVRALLPGWHTGILAGILLFIVLDRIYVHRQLKRLTPLTSDWAVTVGIQWIVISVFSWFLLSYAEGPENLRANLAQLARGAIFDIISVELVMILFLAGSLWALTAQFLGLLDEIGLDMDAALSDEPLRQDAIPAHQRLVGLIFTTGIVLVILTALTRLNLRTIVSSPGSLPPVAWNSFSGAEAGALLFFVFGLALLSLSRLMSLQTHWNRLRIPVTSAELPRQWALYSLFFLLLLAGIVSLLPAGDSLGLFAVIGTLFGFLLQVLVFLSQLIVGLVLLLLSLPFILFGKAPPVIAESAPPPMPVMPTAPQGEPFESALWELVRSILLWGGLIAILVYAFIRFVQQHESLLAALRRSRITNWLAHAWQWLYRQIGRTQSRLARVVADGWQSLRSRMAGPPTPSRPGWLRLRSLDPRRRILFYYLAMVRRGEEQGLARRPSQTPAEYAASLERALPPVEEDIDSITRAFVEARYSRRDVDPGQAKTVKDTWDRIRRALQELSKRAKSRKQ